MARCLILGCSEAKRNDREPLPALERYDGPAFHVVRRFLADANPVLRNVDIYVLSAQYGLIASDECVVRYNRRMTATRAAELRPEVLSQLRVILSHHYAELFISLSKLYLQTINGFESSAPNGTQVTISQAAMGKRLTELKHWLYGLPKGTLVTKRSNRLRRPKSLQPLQVQQVQGHSNPVLLKLSQTVRNAPNLISG